MNYTAIRRTLGIILKFEAVFLLLPCITSLVYAESQGVWFLIVAVCSFIIGQLISIKSKDSNFFAKEGFIMVALSWIVMSLVGALPFTLCGDIPNYIDAFFETVSGFTTTGASILTDVEALSHTSLIWRSFTHWIGGMGVFVFILAILPTNGGYNMHLMRAESPGPSVGKLVPRLKDTAKILYMLYFALTVLQIICLLIARMPLFDTLCTAFGTAGTGGFGIKNDSFAGYSVAIQVITAVFMILFGVNFNAYFFLTSKNNKKLAFQMEEVRVYFGIIAVAVILITVNILSMCSGLGDALNKAFFQVGSIITTTGFATADFNLWPELSRTILVVLMFCGACAGSTGGGIKVSRIVIMLKSVKTEIQKYIHPRSVNRVKMDGKPVEEETRRGVSVYLLAYAAIFIFSILIISVDNFDFTTNFTAVTATFNNIGPGLGVVGPAGNYAGYSWLSKLVLIIDMLAGRLELYPILILFAPSVWRKKG
ncbi:MAG: TrkH family potassium uptake protein [Lachnospiraceae bacterium]|nr:TrkH family potassium uptake protein [Candidatus Darwinimomas equi]